MTINKIAVLGLGKVGRLAAKLLHEVLELKVTGYDIVLPHEKLDFEVKDDNIANEDILSIELKNYDAVLSCLPYHLNSMVAKIAHKLGIHYFDLTEDVPTTKEIIVLSKTSKAVMIPQCGLAPGFVGIVAMSLYKEFDHARSIRMRVGALPQNPTGLLGYAFNWSPEGVVNEYLNDCEVIENGERKWVSPMEWKETIYVKGIKLEAFTTSGGLGTMCETLQGKVRNIDYKSMRYPGHMELMNFYFHELLMRNHRKEAGEFLTNSKPPVSDDVVYVHVAVEGTIDEKLQRKEFVRSYNPIEISQKEERAIAWTTSSSVVAIIEMVANGKLPKTGFVKQEEIDLNEFLKTKTGKFFN